MMRQKLRAISLLRQQLITTTEQQRQSVKQCAQDFNKTIALAESGFQVISFIRHHPIFLILTSLIFTKTKVSGFKKTGGFIWLLWQIASKVNRSLKK